MVALEEDSNQNDHASNLEREAFNSEAASAMTHVHTESIAERVDKCTPAFGSASVSVRYLTLVAAALLVAAVVFGFGATAAAEQESFRLLGPAHDVDAIMGPKACAECHKTTAQVWELSLHHTLIKKSHRTKEGRSFAKKLGVKRIKDPEGLCASCHYTVQKAKKRPKVIAGVSCETCHGAARDWIKVHSEFSGKKEEQESPEEEEARWAKSEEAGMIRPRNLYALASNCFSCHSTANEKLINVGGHPTGGDFELLSWTMGEVRHNVWYTKPNDEALPERRRMMYLAGLSLTLATSLEALAEVEEPGGTYATYMQARANGAAAKLAKAAGLLVDVPALKAMVDAAPPQGAAPEALKAAATAVGEHARRLLERDGSGMEAVDDMLPGPNAYVGQVASP